LDRDSSQFHGVRLDRDPHGAQKFLGNSPADHSADGFPARGASAAAMVPDSVLGLIGEIRVPRSEHVL